MKLRLSLLAALTCLGTMSGAHTPLPCPQPGGVMYPIGQLIELDGLSLEFDFTKTEWPDYGSPEHVAQNRQIVLGNLEGKSQAERDALLLGRLSWSTQGAIPLLGITAFPDAGLFDAYLDVLERHDMTRHASALRTTRAAFPNWNTTAQNRYAQWNDPETGINPVLDATLRAQSDALKIAQPPLLEKAEQILSAHPVYDKYIEARKNVDPSTLHTYLMIEIGACVPRYQTPAEADAALASIDPLLADLHVIDLFLLEALNGGMHQYMSNSTGMLAPQLLDVLTRWDLPEQAQAVRDTLAYFPTPFPRDREARNKAFASFSDATDDAVNTATWIADDPEIWDAVRARAEASGYWPQ